MAGADSPRGGEADGEGSTAGLEPSIERRRRPGADRSVKHAVAALEVDDHVEGPPCVPEEVVIQWRRFLAHAEAALVGRADAVPVGVQVNGAEDLQAGDLRR